jgi:hypothetical protein
MASGRREKVLSIVARITCCPATSRQSAGRHHQVRDYPRCKNNSRLNNPHLAASLFAQENKKGRGDPAFCLEAACFESR